MDDDIQAITENVWLTVLGLGVARCAKADPGPPGAT
jgi:hypothetical protein